MNRLDVVAIDDEFTVLYTVRAILEPNHPDMEAFTDPSEAVGFLQRTGARVVITDFSMPGLSGIEVLDRALAADPDTQVVLLTAHGSEKLAVEAMKRGAFYYITKPFDPEELRLVVQKALDQYHLRKKIHYDQELARTLQHNLLPVLPPEHGPFRLAAHYQPGGAVGGDYYDFTPLPDGGVGLLVADAMGHGVSAAMIMAMLKIAFQNTAPEHPRPDNLLQALNRQFHPILKGRSYFTAFAAVLHPDPPRLACASAGHPFPLFLRGAGGEFVHQALSGMAIGLMPDFQYPIAEFPLHPGDRLLLYTDGLADLEPCPAFFDDFQNHLRRISYTANEPWMPQLIDRVKGAAVSRQDDLTMVLVEYTPSGRQP